LPPTPEVETLEELFELPLDEFTAARNALARRLRHEGDAETAEQVRGLTKPSVAAWAVNQLARREPEGVRSLLNVAARLRSAQERSLQGERAADELRAAQAEEREVIRGLAQRAGELLRENDRPASGTTLEKVSSLLRAAAVGEPGRTALREGRLTGDVEVTGFDAFAGLKVPKGRRRSATSSGDDLAERRRQKREEEQQRKRLQKEVRELTTRAEASEREAEKARKAADEAAAEAAERRRQADAAAAELAELET